MTAQNARFRANRRRVLASAGVLGVAATVAGLGTFGTFTDSTTPVVTQLDTGVLSIALTEAADAATLSLFDNGSFLAGDAESSAIDLVNDGSVALSELRLTSTATTSSALDSDADNGLQLLVESCSVDWELDAGLWSCAGTTARHYDGPIVADTVLGGSTGLAPAGVDHLLLTASLPSTTTDELVAGAVSELDFTFSAVQRDGGAR